MTPTWTWREPVRNTDYKDGCECIGTDKSNEGDGQERSYPKSLQGHVLTKCYGTKENKLNSNSVLSLANSHLQNVSL